MNNNATEKKINEKDLLDKLAIEKKVEYYTLRINLRMNIFTLLGITVALLGYIYGNYLKDLFDNKKDFNGNEFDLYYGLFMVSLIGFAFFYFLISIYIDYNKIIKFILKNGK